MHRYMLALLLAAASLSVGGCTQAADETKTSSPATSSSSSGKAADSGKTGNVATVDGVPITQAQLEEHVAA